MHETANITMGSGCLVAGGVSMSTSDVDIIIDLPTGALIDVTGDTSIGEHV